MFQIVDFCSEVNPSQLINKFVERDQQLLQQRQNVETMNFPMMRSYADNTAKSLLRGWGWIVTSKSDGEVQGKPSI